MPDYMMDEEEGQQPPEEGMPAPEQDPENEGGKTALLDKAILEGKHFDVGDEVILRIVAMHDNEIEVAYASEPAEGEGSDEGAPGGEAPPAEAGAGSADPYAEMMG